MTPDEKAERYREVAAEIAATIDGESYLIARMATVSNLLHHAFDHYFWTGFYLVDPNKERELVIGPYQGTLGCLRIPFEKGVCGACATRRETILVEDVHEFPGHIACDSRSESEIVVPVSTVRGVSSPFSTSTVTEKRSSIGRIRRDLRRSCRRLLGGRTLREAYVPPE